MTMRISANRIDADDKVLEKPVIKDYGLTAIGGASGAAVASGYHLDFDGDDYVTATGLLGSPSVVSLCAWVRLDTPDSGGSEIISLGDGATIRVDDGASGVVGFYHYSSSWNTTPTSVDIEGTGWHHICYVCDPASSVQYVYIDGVQQASSTYSQAISYTGLGSNTEIGRHGNSATTRDLDGAVDDVRVYGRALTATEASTLFQGGSISSTSLLAHWAMDDGSGNASDSSGNGYTGTVTGATWTSGSATASYTIDLTQGNVCNLTLDAQQTALTFSNPPATGTHGSLTLLLKQDSTGSRLVTWPAAVRWLSNTTPTLSTTANAVDMFTFTTIDGGTSWIGTASGQQFTSIVTWTFVGSCTGTTSLDFSSLSSGSIQAGDFAVYIDYAMTTSIPTEVVPTGFTNRVSTGYVSSGQDMRGMISDKKLDGSEAVVSGMDGVNRLKIGLVFRPSSSFSTITASTPTSEATDGNPASQVIDPSAETAPVILVGVTAVGGAAATFSTASPAWDATVVGSTNWLLSGYKIYGAAAAASHTIDSNDLGTQNWLAGIYYKA